MRAAALAVPRARRPNATFSRTDRWGNNRSSWKHTPTRRRSGGSWSIAFAVELDRGVLGGFDEARERFDDGGLAGAVGSEEREGLAVVRFEHGAHVEVAASDGEVGAQSHVSAPS